MFQNIQQEYSAKIFTVSFCFDFQKYSVKIFGANIQSVFFLVTFSKIFGTNIRCKYSDCFFLITFAKYSVQIFGANIQTVFFITFCKIFGRNIRCKYSECFFYYILQNIR